jgi:hypothetical protein
MYIFVFDIPKFAPGFKAHKGMSGLSRQMIANIGQKNTGMVENVFNINRGG